MHRVGTGVSLQPYFDDECRTSPKDFKRLEKVTDRRLAIMGDRSKRGQETNRSENTKRSAELRPLAPPRWPQSGGSGD